MSRRKEEPRSRADWLMPYAERYLDLVIEREWRAHRMNSRDVAKLNNDIKVALVDFETARSHEDGRREEKERLTKESTKPTRELLKSRWEGQAHPWNNRLTPKK